MILVSEPHRPVPNGQTTPRFSQRFAERVLAKCVLPAWVLYVVALCALHALVIGVARAVRSKRLQKRLVCFAVVFNLLLWPGTSSFGIPAKARARLRRSYLYYSRWLRRPNIQLAVRGCRSLAKDHRISQRSRLRDPYLPWQDRRLRWASSQTNLLSELLQFCCAQKNLAPPIDKLS